MRKNIPWLIITIFMAMTMFVSCENDTTSSDDEQPTQNFTIKQSEELKINIDGGLSILIPESTFTKDVSIQIKELENLEDNPYTGMTQFGKAYEIIHDDFYFTKPVEISFEMDSSFDTSKVFIGRFNGENWQSLKTKFDYENGKITAETPGFSKFATFSGSTPEISGPSANPPEFSGVDFDGSGFDQDLDITAIVSDEDNDVQVVVIELKIKGTLTGAYDSMNELKEFFSTDFSDFQEVMKLIGSQNEQEESYFSVRFLMDKEDGSNYSLKLTKDQLIMINTELVTLKEIRAMVYAYDSSLNEKVSDEIVIPVLTSKKPKVKLLTPNVEASIQPTFKWELDDNGMSTEYSFKWKNCKIFIDDSDKPFEATFKTDTHLGDAWFENEYTTTKGLEPGKRYWWQVRVSQDNNYDNFEDPKVAVSEIRSFIVLENQSPSEPVNPIPLNNETGINKDRIEFSWDECVDPDNDIISYQLYFTADQNEFDNEPIYEGTETSFGYTTLLEYGTKYYWFVRATDGENTNDSELWNFTTLENGAPTAVFTVSPTSGTTETTFSFDASACEDDEDETSTLQVRWDYDGNGSYDTNWSTTKTATHKFSTADTYTLKLEVKDSQGLTGTTTKTVSVTVPANEIPTCEINNPADGFTANVGDGISLRAEATDSDGSVTSVKFEVKLGNSVVFEQTDTTGDSNNYYRIEWDTEDFDEGDYLVKATAVDNQGAEAYDEISISLVGGEEEYINITNPTAGLEWIKEELYTIEWDDNIDDNVKIELYKGSNSVKIISSSTASDGSFGWIINEDLTEGSDYRIRISSIAKRRQTNSIVSNKSIKKKVSIKKHKESEESTSSNSVEAYSEYFTISKPATAEDLIAYYPFNNGSVADESGNGHDGENHGANGDVSDRHGKPSSAMNFDGVDDYITIPQIDLSSERSFSAWIKTSSSGSIVFRGDSYPGQYHYFFGVNGSGNFYYGHKGGGNPYINSQSEVNDNNWHHLVATWDGSTTKLYLDGALDESGEDTTSPTGTSSGGTFIGASNSNGNIVSNFQGLLDDIIFYNCVLTEDEIDDLYHEGGYTGNTPPTISISEPADGSSFTVGETIQIKHTSSDDEGWVASVALYANDELLGDMTVTPFSYNWFTTDVEPGTYTLKSIATDNDGLTAESEEVTITINSANTPPTITIDSPADGANFTVGETIRIETTGQDSEGWVEEVKLYANEELLTTLTVSPFDYIWLTDDVATGSYTIKAVPTDNAGLEGESTVITITITSGNVIPGMILVDGGTFTMGDRLGNGSSNETPTHEVTVSSFYIGKYELTHAEFITFLNSRGVDSNGSYNGNELIDMNDSDCAIDHNGSFYFGGSSYASSEDCPVIEVTWYGATEYCNWLSEQDGLQSCYSISSGSVDCDFNKNGYRLPTEAEWEYAARGGVHHIDNYKYAGTTDNLGDYAWYSSNSGSITHEVGTKLPNQLGIYDMSGNVYEWCWDWYSSSYYSSSPSDNPIGPSSGSNRVIRGGSWNNDAIYTRVAYLYYGTPSSSYYLIGFRLLRTVQ